MAVNKILISGSSGTIGTRLCERLMQENIEVVPVDLHSNKWSKKIDASTIRAQLTERWSRNMLPDHVDMVVHLAAHARVYNLVQNPHYAKENVDMLFNMLEYSRLNRVPRFIFASSREVYGNLDNSSFNEKDIDVENCESPYTASKIAGESFVHAYSKCYNINNIIFRFSNVYGMYDSSDRIVPLFIRKTRDNEDLTIYGKEKKLDFTYIDDAVSGIMSGIKNFDHVKGETFNIASGKGTKLTDLALIIQEAMGKKTRIVAKENRSGEIMNYTADISKAREKLGYDPKIGIQEGIKRSIDWYLNSIK